MTLLSGPFNIQQGNTAKFSVVFFDVNGTPTVPASASMTVTYTNTSNTQQVDSVTLLPVSRFFQGTWSSTSAALGLATVAATTSLSSVQVASIQLRIIDRMIG